MKNQITVVGINGSFNAEIEVLLNYKSASRKVMNPSTHEEEDFDFTNHCVRGLIGDEIIATIEFTNEETVWMHIDEIRRKLTAKLQHLANFQKIKTIEQQLRDKGFK